MNIFAKIYWVTVFIAALSDFIFNAKLMFFGTKKSKLRTQTIFQMILWTAAFSFVPVVNIIFAHYNFKSIFMKKELFFNKYKKLIQSANN